MKNTETQTALLSFIISVLLNGVKAKLNLLKKAVPFVSPNRRILALPENAVSRKYDGLSDISKGYNKSCSAVVLVAVSIKGCACQC